MGIVVHVLHVSGMLTLIAFEQWARIVSPVQEGHIFSLSLLYRKP